MIAIGSNREATLLSGVNVRFYHVLVYTVCGLFTGVAALAYAAATPTIQPDRSRYGDGCHRRAIVGGVSAAGGYGTIPGIFVGTCVILGAEGRSAICRSECKLAADHYGACIAGRQY